MLDNEGETKAFPDKQKQIEWLADLFYDKY